MSDLDKFEETIEEISDSFQKNPFQYGIEQPVRTELYHLLRNKLENPWKRIKFLTHYGDGSSTVRDAAALEEKGRALRVRTENSFVHNEDSWTPEFRKNSYYKFDLTVFEDNDLVMQSKSSGPSNYWDTENDISILCEVKHPKNKSYRGTFTEDAVDDVIALSNYPGNVEKRALVLLDWWPEKQRENYYKEKLVMNAKLRGMNHEVEFIYLPRNEDTHREIIS